MRGDRHMATVRSHNKVFRIKRERAKPLTKKQIRAKLHAISNRGKQEDH